MRNVGWALFFVLMVGGLGAMTYWIWQSTRPRGDLVASFDPEQQPSISFDAKAADEIGFRLDYSFDINPVRNMLSGDDDRVVQEVLDSSRLDVELEDSSGAKQRTSCSAYEGSAEVSGQVGPRHSRSGVNVDCKFLVPRDGTYKASGRVTFGKGRLVDSKIEVRRVRPR